MEGKHDERCVCGWCVDFCDGGDSSKVNNLESNLVSYCYQRMAKYRQSNQVRIPRYCCLLESAGVFGDNEIQLRRKS